MQRLSTGNLRLDDILGGGLISDAITLVVGAPGTGKTILAEQCLFANATPERPGLYLSTVSEPLDKLLRFGQALSFFDVDQIGRSVFYDDLGDVVHQHGLNEVTERIDGLIKQHRPGIIVIDSFKALRTWRTASRLRVQPGWSRVTAAAREARPTTPASTRPFPSPPSTSRSGSTPSACRS